MSFPTWPAGLAGIFIKPEKIYAGTFCMLTQEVVCSIDPNEKDGQAGRPNTYNFLFRLPRCIPCLGKEADSPFFFFFIQLIPKSQKPIPAFK